VVVGWLLVRISAIPGERSGDFAWNICCLWSSFQYSPSRPVVNAPSSCIREIGWSQVSSDAWGGSEASRTSGRGSVLGCRHLHCKWVCHSTYSALEVLQITGEFVLRVGVTGEIWVGVASPGCITAVGGLFVDHCFFNGGGHHVSFCSYSSSLP
jgi:hypothetical protein